MDSFIRIDNTVINTNNVAYVRNEGDKKLVVAFSAKSESTSLHLTFLGQAAEKLWKYFAAEARQAFETPG